jgi:hypothetical protein
MIVPPRVFRPGSDPHIATNTGSPRPASDFVGVHRAQLLFQCSRVMRPLYSEGWPFLAPVRKVARAIGARVSWTVEAESPLNHIQFACQAFGFGRVELADTARHVSDAVQLAPVGNPERFRARRGRKAWRPWRSASVIRRKDASTRQANLTTPASTAARLR